MKQLLTFLVATLFVVNGFGQTQVLFDFESEAGDAGFWGDASKKEVVENPTGDGKCFKLTIEDGNGPNRAGKGFAEIKLNGRKRISMRVMKTSSENIILQLEGVRRDSEGNPLLDEFDNPIKFYEEAAAYYDNGSNDENTERIRGEWKTLVIDFSKNGIDDYIDVLILKPNVWAGFYPEEVYFDDIRIEDSPLVSADGGESVIPGDLEDNALTEAKTLALTGTWMQGESSKVTGGWETFTYNDLEVLKNKIGINAALTTVDLRAADTSRNPNNIFHSDAINPNSLVYANEGFPVTDNVIINGEASRVSLVSGYDYHCAEAFATNDIIYTRECYNDGAWESFVLPFTLSGIKEGDNDISADDYEVETFQSKSTDGNSILFDVASTIETNVPSILRFVNGNGVKTTYTFCGWPIEGQPQQIAATPSSATVGSIFKGTYAQVDVTGKYLLNEQGQAFGRAQDGLRIPSFYTYLDMSGSNVRERYAVVHGEGGGGTTDMASSETSLPFIYGTDSAIIMEAATPQQIRIIAIDGRIIQSFTSQPGRTVVDGLNKGIYIVNGRKIVIK